MNNPRAVTASEAKARSSNRVCCIAHVRSLLAAIRLRHHPLDPKRRARLPQQDNADDGEDLPKATLHDCHAGELEASVGAPEMAWRQGAESEIRHDSPREIARARRVFALSLLIPLLLISAVLGLFGGELDRASGSLLQFSAWALALPLGLAAAAAGYRSLRSGDFRS